MEDNVYPGHLILLVSVPGGGKSTLINYLRTTDLDISFAVSCTSRPMRPGEVEGENYYFLTPEEFERRIKAGEFLEWIQQDGGRYYGTLKSEILEKVKAGNVVVREVEIRGARVIRDLLPPENLSIIFVTAGSWEEMAKRIKERAPITEEELEHRRQRYEREVVFRDEADYVIENRNGELERAQSEIFSIVTEIIDKTK